MESWLFAQYSSVMQIGVLCDIIIVFCFIVVKTAIPNLRESTETDRQNESAIYQILGTLCTMCLYRMTIR